MKLAVIGSRNFVDYSLLCSYLTKINDIKEITHIISGGAIGADRLGLQWAKSNNKETIIFFPEWKKYGKRAGFLRNNDIIESSDKVIAFWDGKSKGTEHSIKLCKKLNKKCKIVYCYTINQIRSQKIKKIYNRIERNRFHLRII